MAVGAGLSASFGIATETTPGVPVAVTRFVEFDSESIAMKKHTVQGAGLRNGARVKRSARRILTGREFNGDVQFDPTTNGFGLFLQHMLGSTPGAPTSIGGGLFRQVHNTGPLSGKSFTAQVLRPDTSGVLTQGAFTYTGCKITDWELSAKANEQLQAKFTIDALDEATPSNGFAATTLSALTTAGATSFTAVASIPAGSWVVVDTGANAEVVQTGTPSGAGPYTIPVSSAGGLKVGHATGVYVGSATGVNYGAATALQTASYNATTTLFGFNNGSLIAGGTTATTGGLYTNTGGQVVANVTSVTISGKNAVDTGRFSLGSSIRSEQLDNGWAEYTADVEVEYSGRAFYDAYAADLQIDLQLTFTSPGGNVLTITAPAGFQDDGATPNVGGPDLITQKLKFTLLDDGVNGPIQAVYVSTDAAV